VQNIQQTAGISIMAKYRGAVCVVAMAMTYAITAMPRQDIMILYMASLRCTGQGLALHSEAKERAKCLHH
jgi:hypothetical protein